MASAQAMQSFASAAAQYLKDDQFSDFTIVCEGREFKVHRCIISAHSKYFKQCCSGTFEEARNQGVELKEDPKEVVEKMISFFYTCDYDDEVTSDPLPDIKSGRPANEAQMNAWVYAVAEKYDIPALKKVALEKFRLNTDDTDAQHMVGAALAIFKHAPVPEADVAMKHVLCVLWATGGSALMANVGHETLVELNTIAPAFMATYYATTTSWTGIDAWIVRCSECKVQQQGIMHPSDSPHMADCTWCTRYAEMELKAEFVVAVPEP